MSQPENYRDVRAFSQSSLKLLDFSPQKFYWDEYRWVMGLTDDRPIIEPSDAMNLGSIVDILLTRPNDLDTEFAVVKGAPIGQLKAFIDEFWRLEQSGVTDTGQASMEAYLAVGIKQSKLETMVARFQAEGLVYYNSLRQAVGKTVVPEEMMDKAKALVKGMEEDEFMGPIVLQESSMEVLNEWIEVHDQLAIYWETEDGIKLKALLDKVIVDHLKKEVHPYDIKTCGDSYFPDSFAKWRYDLQGAFYTDALRVWMKKQGIEEYELKPFKFLVCFTNDKGIPPQIWEMTDSDYIAGRLGVVHPRRPIRIKGYVMMLDNLRWHMKEDKWKYPREVYGRNGVRELNYYVDEPRRY